MMTTPGRTAIFPVRHGTIFGCRGRRKALFIIRDRIDDEPAYFCTISREFDDESPVPGELRQRGDSRGVAG